MNPNPYESPRIPPNAGTEPESSSESTHQVLVDIRSLQREMLTLTKDAVERQRRTVRMMLVLLAGVTLFGVLIIILFAVSAFLSLWAELPNP
jgi:hypothetical protein